MSIAYIDPGNIESDLQVGAVTQYKVCGRVCVGVWVCMCVHMLSHMMNPCYCMYLCHINFVVLL